MDFSRTEDDVILSGEAAEKANRPQPSPSYFSTPGLEGLQQQLEHLLRFGEGLPVVQGGRGGGKSTLAVNLVERLADCGFLQRVSCDVEENISELLFKVVTGFGLSSTANAGECLAALRQFSTQLAANKELAVLVVDDAQCLDEQGLGAMLSLLQGNNHPSYGLHMAFYSSPGLVEKIDEMGMLDVPVYDFEIPLFSPSELSGFLKARFDTATASQFSAGFIQNTWSQSLGSPGQALRLVEKSGVADFDEGESGLGVIKKMPKGHIAALAILFLVLMWVLFSGKKAAETDIDSVAVQSIETRESESLPTDIISEKADDAGEVTPANADASSVDTVSRVQEEVSIAPSVVEGRDAQDNEALEVPSAADERVQANIASASQDDAERVVTKPLTEPLNSSERVSPTAPSGLTSDELFLLDQEPKAYTLQLIAASRKAALEDYMVSQANRSELRLYQGLREGKAWYVVVTGVFATRSQAQQAISELPASQQKAGPWPKQLSRIQSEIAANRSK